MAVVYDKIKGMEIAEAIAHQEDVQGDLDIRSTAMGSKAKWLLNGHRLEGHSRILVETGDIDRYIILDDERGLLGAYVIEMGRKGDENGKGFQAGKFILHDATGLPR